MLGAGLGLLSVASIVGAQSTVSWGQRGVVTGTVMFCRYLGQSLGAAIFGAIFNAALSGKLHGAPAALRHRLPGQVSGVATALARPQDLGQAAGTTCRRDRHRHHPRLRRAHGGGRADHRRRAADHAKALQHGRRGERVHRPAASPVRPAGRPARLSRAGLTGARRKNRSDRPGSALLGSWALVLPYAPEVMPMPSASGTQPDPPPDPAPDPRSPTRAPGRRPRSGPRCGT